MRNAIRTEIILAAAKFAKPPIFGTTAVRQAGHASTKEFFQEVLRSPLNTTRHVVSVNSTALQDSGLLLARSPAMKNVIRSAQSRLANESALVVTPAALHTIARASVLKSLTRK